MQQPVARQGSQRDARSRFRTQLAGKPPSALATPSNAAGLKSRARVAGWPVVTTDELNATIAANIVLARKLANDMSQAELSALTGIDVKQISRYENGRRVPLPQRLIEIAAATGQTVGWFWDPHDDLAGRCE